jgi:hypothetical protein
MYRACSTWQYDVVGHLLEQYRGGQRLGYLSGEEFDQRTKDATSTASWRVLKFHEGDPVFAAALAEGRARAVYAYRDLRDVAFSLAHKFSTTFADIVEQRRLIHLCLANDRFWRCQPGVLCQRYEDLVADPVRGIRAIAGHLDIPLTETEAQAMACAYSLTSNRDRTLRLTRRLREEGLDLDDPSNTLRHDAHSLLHWNHIREGKIGSWRRQATPEQTLLLGQLCGPWLIANGYEADNAWTLPAFETLRNELHVCRGELRQTRDQLAQVDHRLADVGAELEETCRQLHALEQLGPVALGLARRFHELSVGYPRLAGTVKRLVVGWRAA